jgi:hypothetical protein
LARQGLRGIAPDDLKQASKIKCGLARDYGLSAIHELTDQPLSRASPLPHF